tara:strand:- start:299 stop:538 length:240 start_codon:yes stop_codon:yes gene_type:complete
MLNTKTKKVTGFWGAGISLSFGEVVNVYTDNTVDILWNDGNKVNYNFNEIKVGNHENGIGIYWGVDKEAIPFSSYWEVA